MSVNRRWWGVANKVTGEVTFYAYGHASAGEALDQHCFPWKAVSSARFDELQASDPSFEVRIRTRENEYIYPEDPRFVGMIGEARNPGGRSMVEVRIASWNERDRARADFHTFDPKEQFGGEWGKAPSPGVGRRWAMDNALGRCVQSAIPEEVERLLIEEDRADRDRQEALRIVGSGSRLASDAAVRVTKAREARLALQGQPVVDSHPIAKRLIP